VRIIWIYKKIWSEGTENKSDVCQIRVTYKIPSLSGFFVEIFFARITGSPKKKLSRQEREDMHGGERDLQKKVYMQSCE